ncbi:zinc finger, CCHC-type containing protein [Tanacetum coccineum]
MMLHKQSTHTRRTYAPQHKVLTNDDLLTQILIRLPILSIHLFTTVSKQWLRILTSPDFTRNRRQIRNIDPPAGLFVNHITSLFHCVFVSLDTRIKSTKYTSDKSFTLGYTEAVVNVNILQSCNDYAHDDSNFYGCAGLRLAFDPTKSPDYKVDEGWSIRSTVWSIVLGEREDNSFLIINLSAKVVQYNLISKTLREIYDMGSNEIPDDYLYGFILPYAMYDVGYKKLDYKVFEFIPSSARV